MILSGTCSPQTAEICTPLSSFWPERPLLLFAEQPVECLPAPLSLRPSVPGCIVALPAAAAASKVNTADLFQNELCDFAR